MTPEREKEIRAIAEWRHSLSTHSPCGFAIHELFITLDRLRAEQQWKPIETRPEQKRIWVSYVTDYGRRRTTAAIFYPAGTTQMSDECSDDLVDENGNNVNAGWWEVSTEHEIDAPLSGEPDRWLDIPSPPKEPGAKA